MYNKLSVYKRKLEEEIADCVSGSISERSASHTDTFIGYWMNVCAMQEKIGHGQNVRLTEQDMTAWNSDMVNEDGTHCGHWSIDQTSAVAKEYGVEFSHITPLMWNVTMNMMYSDYFSVAQSFGVDEPSFYAYMAKAFLFDKDGPGPEEKLSAYYHGIVEG